MSEKLAIRWAAVAFCLAVWGCLAVSCATLAPA